MSCHGHSCRGQWCGPAAQLTAQLSTHAASPPPVWPCAHAPEHDECVVVVSATDVANARAVGAHLVGLPAEIVGVAGLAGQLAVPTSFSFAEGIYTVAVPSRRLTRGGARVAVDLNMVALRPTSLRRCPVPPPHVRVEVRHALYSRRVERLV